MSKFEERFRGKEDVKTNTCDDVSEVTDRYLGVSRNNNKWHAQIRHPDLKFGISLGSYDTAEEAALVVKKKKAEYEEMFKGDKNRTNVETCRVDFEGRELPSGVYSTKHGKWSARIHHPKLKRNVKVGYYDTIEEAAIAAENKRLELWLIYGWRPKVNPDCKYDGKVLEKNNPEAVSTPEISEELTGDSNTIVKDMAKAELPAKRKRTEFESSAMDRPASEANEAPMTRECELGSGCQTSVLCSENLNNICVNDKSNYGVGVASAPNILESNGVHVPPTLVLESEKSNNADFNDKRAISKGNSSNADCASGFDEAMSSDIINEYGQLLGMYSELDKTMAFSEPDEDVADLEYFSSSL